MPTNIMGIPGLNPWNLLLAVVLFHWIVQRSAEKRKWDLRGLPLVILVCYVLVVCIGFFRAAIDIDSFAAGSMATSGGGRADYTAMGLFVDELVNPLRYMIPGLLVYDGCRTRRRIVAVLAAIITMGLCYALFIVKYVPLGTLMGTEPVLRSRNRIDREIGLHANDMAFALVFIFWTAVACLPLLKRHVLKAGVLCAVAVIGLAVALCESRGGFAGFVALGAMFVLLRKPILLPLVVVAVMLIPVAAPGIATRVDMGFSEGTVAGDTENNWDEITAGRFTNLWPVSMAYIAKSPVLGYGRYAMLRNENLYRDILAAEGSVPTHPHNAYLEVLLDYGGIGFVVVMAPFVSITLIALKQMRRRGDDLVRIVGTIAFLAVLDNMVVGISSRAFLPRPSTVAMWCAFALSLRVWAEQRRAAATVPARQSMILLRPQMKDPLETRAQRV